MGLNDLIKYDMLTGDDKAFLLDYMWDLPLPLRLFVSSRMNDLIDDVYGKGTTIRIFRDIDTKNLLPVISEKHRVEEVAYPHRSNFQKHYATLIDRWNNNVDSLPFGNNVNFEKMFFCAPRGMFGPLSPLCVGPYEYLAYLEKVGSFIQMLDPIHNKNANLLTNRDAVNGIIRFVGTEILPYKMKVAMESWIIMDKTSSVFPEAQSLDERIYCEMFNTYRNIFDKCDIKFKLEYIENFGMLAKSIITQFGGRSAVGELVNGRVRNIKYILHLLSNNSVGFSQADDIDFYSKMLKYDTIKPVPKPAFRDELDVLEYTMNDLAIKEETKCALITQFPGIHLEYVMEPDGYSYTMIDLSDVDVAHYEDTSIPRKFILTEDKNGNVHGLMIEDGHLNGNSIEFVDLKDESITYEAKIRFYNMD